MIYTTYYIKSLLDNIFGKRIVIEEKSIHVIINSIASIVEVKTRPAAEPTQN